MALAELSWEKEDRDRATAYARQALQASDISTQARVSSLLILAGAAMRDQEFEEASRLLEEVVRRQRAANDWYFLGLCYLELDQPSRALAGVAAIADDPTGFLRRPCAAGASVSPAGQCRAGQGTRGKGTLALQGT